MERGGVDERNWNSKVEPRKKAEGVKTAGLPRCRLLLEAPSSSPSAYSRWPVKEHYQLAAR